MTVQFERRTDRPDAAGRCTIRLTAYFDGKRVFYPTREKCLASEWQTDKQKFRRSMPGFQEANEYLDSLTARVQAAYRQLRTSGIEPTPESLKAVLVPAAPVEQPKPAPPQLLVSLFDEYRTAMEARGMRYNTLRSIGTTRNILAEFAQKMPKALTLDTYNMAMHDRILGFLRRDRKLAQNSIWKTVKQIKSFLIYLQKDRWFTLAVEPRQLKVEWTDVEKVYLTADELAALETVKVPEGLERTRDAFLFCCYTGLRYSDLAALQESNLQDWGKSQVLRLTQTKTRSTVSIYLTATAAALLAKYKGQGVRLMPVMANQVMNRNLKELTRRVGLKALVEVVEVQQGRLGKRQVPKYELVTMHTARHTFATQSLLRGMPVEVLQKVMGHARLQTTLIYAKIVEDFQHQTMQRIWDGAAAVPAAGPAVRVDDVCIVVPDKGLSLVA